MRKAINENPVVQAGLVGVLALAVGLMLLMRTGGSGEDTATTDAAATQAVAAGTPESDASATATATPATPAPTDPATGAAAPATPDAAAATGAPTDFKPGPGLPADLVNAYDDGKAVALMIFNDDGIDDRELKAIVGQVALARGRRRLRDRSRRTSRTTRGSPGASTSTAPRRSSSSARRS